MDVSEELNAKSEDQAKYSNIVQIGNLRSGRRLSQFTASNIFAAQHHEQQNEHLMLSVDAASSPDF